jgi:RNA polymerase sigma-70 factor (ECF subfamily)
VIDDAIAGNQRSFDAIYRAFEPLLSRYLRAVSPGLAEDVSAAAWESVASSLRRFSGNSDQFRSWLFTIARRRLVDEVRSSTRRPLVIAEVPDGLAADSHVDPAGDGPDWALEFLRLIPTRQADAVLLRVIGGLTVDETADVLGITAGNVRVLCHRGLNAIQELLESSVDANESIPSAV